MFRILNIALIKFLMTILLSSEIFYLTAQDKYGYIWAAGFYPVKAHAYTPNFMNTSMDYNRTLYVTSASISDIEGNLLFFTNGIRVFTKDGLVMKGGDSITFNQYWHIVEQSGMASEQGAIILPSLYSNNRYIIFHYSSIDTSINVRGISAPIANKLLYSYVDMTGDLGQGEVLSKNDVLLDNVLLDPSRMTVCKHANGRDWWIIKNAFLENKYFKFLHTSQGILGPFVQQIGAEFDDVKAPPNVFFGRAVFSEDGTKYATISGRGPIVVMDFDRCSGEFSNVQTFNYVYQVDSALAAQGHPDHVPNVLGGISVALSPNGRFLYANHLATIDQFDLQSGKNDSVQLVHLGEPLDNPN
jgi:hypothetical protein